LDDVKVPMLFLQGTRDALAELDQLKPVCKALGRRATLELFEAADYSFHVPARSGRKDAEVLGECSIFFAAGSTRSSGRNEIEAAWRVTSVGAPTVAADCLIVVLAASRIQRVQRGGRFFV
jgi:hypothetical protein